jgi:hypothetical protein
MTDTITLYTFQSDDIRISIEAYFDGDNLVIDGYDIGKRVEEYWGDSDYEYVLTIPSPSVDFLFRYFEVSDNSRSELLIKLAEKFNTNTCYSDIRKLLESNNQACSGFTWS